MQLMKQFSFPSKDGQLEIKTLLEVLKSRIGCVGIKIGEIYTNRFGQDVLFTTLPNCLVEEKKLKNERIYS